MTEKHYHFCLGNSTHGPIGFCAEIRAISSTQAVERLKEALPESMSVQLDPESRRKLGAVYIEVYLNPEAVTEGDITEIFVPEGVE